MPTQLVSFVPGYPSNWHEIAKAVKTLSHWRCEACGEYHCPERGYSLTVHHLNGDTTDNRYTNLVALCQRCHLRVQANYFPGQLFLFSDPSWVVRRGLRDDVSVRDWIDLSVPLPIAVWN